MKKIVVAVIALCLIIGGLALINYYSPGKAATIQDAVRKAQTMGTTEKKTDYLMKQARLFLDSRDFKGAIDLSQYVLRNLDGNSQEAKKLIRKAQDAAVVQKQMTEAQGGK
jgi:hypothetical protein